jgi:hypothetical protein
MDVIIVEPEKSARKAVIDGNLESLQKVVGGHIEAIYPYEDPVAIVCNEEGKLNGLPLNRRLEDTTSFSWNLHGLRPWRGNSHHYLRVGHNIRRSLRNRKCS